MGACPCAPRAIAHPWAVSGGLARTQKTPDYASCLVRGFPVVALARHTPNTPVALRPPSDRVQRRPRAQTRTTRRDRERLVALYEQGWSGSRIAAELNIAKSTVYATLRRHEVEVRPQHLVY